MQEFQEHSLGGQVFHRLREDILAGKYAQGEELREISLGKELGVSRTPVREALHQLELEGLVEIVPNRGAHVTGITHKDIQDIYQMRVYLEGLAAKLAAENITQDQIAELEEVILLAEFHLKKSNKEEMDRFDKRFHEIMYQASGSRMLSHVLNDFHHYVRLARMMSVQRENRAQDSVREHKEILEAIKTRDGEVAERIAQHHIRNVIKNLNLEGKDSKTE